VTGSEDGNAEGRRRLLRVSVTDEDLEDELDDEVRFHLQAKVERLVREGWDRADAEEEAFRSFGDVERVKSGMRTMSRRKERRMRMGEWRDTLAGDLRYAFRQLRRHPVFALVTTLTLALGIGVNTAIFSVVDGILFRPLPFPQPHELVNIWSDVTARGGPDDEWLSFANYYDIGEQAQTLEAAAAWGGWRPTWTDPEQPEQLLGAQVTQHMFSRVLRVAPQLGPGLRPADDEPGAAPRVVISDGFWHRAFGADPSVVGRTLTLNGSAMEVAGVMPVGFRPPFVPNADLWTFPGIDPQVQQDRRGGFSWRALARVTEGTDPSAADAELHELGSRLERMYVESNTGMTFRAVPLREDMTQSARGGLLVLLAAVALVLLVACVNVANLLLARGTSRTGEMAVRYAMGAGRGRILKQLTTESLVLAAMGGTVAVLFALVGTKVLVSMAPPGTPRLDEVGLNGRILSFTALVTVVAGTLFGIFPALRAVGSDPQHALREGGRGAMGSQGARVRSLLVVGQVGLALVLLMGAGLLARSFAKLQAVDLGFDPANVTSVQVNLTGDYGREERVNFVRALEERIAAVPGVGAVGTTGTIPLTGFDGDVSFHVQGRPLPEPGQEPATWLRRVTPGYLRTMGIELVQGRHFSPADAEDAQRVLIINETLAARFFPGENPVGKLITFSSDPESEEAQWREIVGVARDIRNFGIREDSRMATYIPWAQAPDFAAFPVVRSDLPTDRIVPAIRRAVAEMDPGLAVAQARTMSDVVDQALAPERFVTFLLSLFAGVGLVLAVVGLYGVVSFSVNTRIREMGVRMALGAEAGRISGMVVRWSLKLVAGGVVVGVGASLLLTRLMSGLLFGVDAGDPLTMAGVTVILAVGAAVAAAIPAAKAARVDPARALRSE